MLNPDRRCIVGGPIRASRTLRNLRYDRSWPEAERESSAGAPARAVQTLNAQVNAIVQGAEVRAQFEKLGIAPSPMKPEEFAKFVREQIVTYQRIVKQGNIQQQ